VPDERIRAVDVNRYAYLVPCVENDDLPRSSSPVLDPEEHALLDAMESGEPLPTPLTFTSFATCPG
jgi:hypothetical protein